MRYISSKVKVVSLGILVLLLIITFISISNVKTPDIKVLDLDTFQEYIENQLVIKAKVITIVSDETEEEDYYGTIVTTQTIRFSSIILDKELKDQYIYCRQIIDSQSYKVNSVEVGDIIYLYPSMEKDKAIGDFSEYSRTKQLLLFFAFFAVVLVLFSGLKGLRSLAALIITCMAIFFVFIPRLNNGGNPIISSLLTALIVTIVTLVIVCGFNRKSLSAIIGCLIGIIVAGILAYVMQKTMNMTGIADEQAILLSFSNGYNMNGLMFAAVIIGSLGATMDVAVSIASSLEEVITHSREKLLKHDIVKSGMKIGADIMGTMTNTLILAYVGSALPLIILLSINSAQLGYATSWEVISEEFLRALAGSIGLVFVVPATSLATSLLYHKEITNKSDQIK